MNELNQGDELKIDFDCTQATEALPNWAAENGYPVTNYEQLDDASWTITIQKGIKIYSYKVDKQIFEDRKLSKFNYRCD